MFRASRVAYEDTYNTLQYAERAKAIRVEVHSNVVSAETHISQYVAVIENLKRQVRSSALFSTQTTFMGFFLMVFCTLFTKRYYTQ